MSDIAPTPEEIKEITLQRKTCSDCGEEQMRAKSGVYSNTCRECGAPIEPETDDRTA